MGKKAHKNLGADPKLLVLSTDDRADIDTLMETDGKYLFRSAGDLDTLWGLTIVEVATDTPPMLIDPAALRVLHIGTITYKADPFTGLSTNTTRLLVETNAVFHVRNAEGALLVVNDWVRRRGRLHHAPTHRVARSCRWGTNHAAGHHHGGGSLWVLGDLPPSGSPLP